MEGLLCYCQSAQLISFVDLNILVAFSPLLSVFCITYLQKEGKSSDSSQKETKVENQ